MNTDEHDRQHPRAPARMKAGLRSGHGHQDPEPLEARLQDVSAGGAFIQTDASYRKGDLVTFSVKLPDEEETRLFHGRVRWLKEEPSAGIGVAFVKTRALQDNLQAVAKHLRRVSRGYASPDAQ